MTTNALLDFTDLPRFDLFQASHVAPAVTQLLEDARSTITQLEQSEAIGWDTFVVPLEAVTERLGRAWGVVGHLNAVVDTPELRAAYNENLPKVTEFWTELGQNLKLFEKYKVLQASHEYTALSSARKRIVDNAVRDFRLGGAELADDKKIRFAEIQEQLAALSTRFSENVLDATNAYELVIDDEARLDGLPEDVKQAAHTSAQRESKTGWRFTLHFPSYFPVLQYANDR
ncbi:MAG: hypothetical protein RL564_1446, partial [Pseudomonadota bacterium]